MMERHPLYVLRLAADLTQSELALLSGVSLRAIQTIEARHVGPYMDTRRRLLAALDVQFSRHREIFGPRKGARVTTRPRAARG